MRVGLVAVVLFGCHDPGSPDRPPGDGPPIDPTPPPVDLDADDDGLSDDDEAALGTDPLDADTDDDGLSDGAEVDVADPLDPDSDDDGLLDGEEVAAGADPRDPDSDDDGLLDPDEVADGTDPASADTDGDGLDDPDEPGLGTDPVAFDTDGDTYGDGDELYEGHDPLDPEDRIYLGQWPYYRDKDALPDPGFDGQQLQVGDVFGRVTGIDQYGQEVDLYDWAGSSDFIVIDASATWCSACMATASWLAGDGDPYSWEILYAPVREAVDDGRVQWVTFMTNDGGTVGTDPADVALWHSAFPHDEIAVLTDPDGTIERAMNYGTTWDGDPYQYYPAYVVLDSQLNVVVQGFVWDACDYVMDGLGYSDFF